LRAPRVIVLQEMVEGGGRVRGGFGPAARPGARPREARDGGMVGGESGRLLEQRHRLRGITGLEEAARFFEETIGRGIGGRPFGERREALQRR
jgi:hypothetical protein